MAWSLVSRRQIAAIVAGSMMLSVAVPANAQQPTTNAKANNAKASLADADKAARAKEWTTAARFYDAANKAAPSSEALEGLANALYQAGQLGKAFTAYTEWLAIYGAKAPAAKKKTAETRLKELGEKTAILTITVNEPGAAITLDDEPLGTSPLANPIRVALGPHRLHVTKDGFVTVDEPTKVDAGGARIELTLLSVSTKGKVVVKEKTGKPIRVTVDGVDMGEAPWSGELDAGQHEIGARAVGLVATPQKVTVERGKAEEIELVASSSSASVKLATSDGKGLIYVDGKLVGEGGFIGVIPAGTHKVKVTREGYDPFEEELVLKDKEQLARTITLKLVSTIETGPVQVVERLEGLYGGFNLLGFLTPGGLGSSIETQCEAKATIPSLVSCDTPSGLGAGLGGFIGYHWDPIGIELYVAGHYDARTLKNDWNAASTDPGLGADPARTEEFTLRRAGGMALGRIRVTTQSTRVRWSLALGAGVAYRAMFLERRTRAKDSSGEQDLFVPDNAETYVSPVIAFEPAVLYRLSPGTAVSLGVQAFFETPTSFLNDRETPKTERDSTHRLGLRGLTTPSYELASNVQIFVGPVLGMMFGP